MKQIKQILFIGAWLLQTHITSADPIITFFFRNYPDVSAMNRAVEKLKMPHGIAKHHMSNIINNNRVAGIFASYFGFLDASNMNGQIMFPRKQSSTTFQLIITNKITPIMMFKNTINHWALEPGTPAELYSIELKEDEETKLSFWQTTKLPLPETNIIPPEKSIIIIAKPENIYVPTGITLARSGANLILPDIYVKKGINSLRNALYALNFTLFFQPVEHMYKKDKTKYEMLLRE